MKSSASRSISMLMICVPSMLSSDENSRGHEDDWCEHGELEDDWYEEGGPGVGRREDCRREDCECEDGG